MSSNLIPPIKNKEKMKHNIWIDEYDISTPVCLLCGEENVSENDSCPLTKVLETVGL